MHFVRERVQSKDLDVRKVFTTYKIADVFTKSLPILRFCNLRDKLALVIPPFSLRGRIEPIDDSSKATSAKTRRLSFVSFD